MASLPLPKREWLEPQADWLPLGLAIFRFGIEDGPGLDARNATSLLELSELEIAKSSAKPFSLGELKKILQEKSCASDADIDPVNGTFSFSVHSAGRSASRMGGPPWAILGNGGDATLKADPRLDAEALFNKEGFMRIGDEDAARYAKQLDAVRKATGLVWHQFMLRAFDRAVSGKRVMLYARIQTASAPVHQLPADLWPILDVIDWQNGLARDPQGVLYYSIHAASAHRPSRALSVAADESAATKALALQLISKPELTRADAFAWCERAGFKLTVRGFQNRVWPKARAQAGLAEKGLPGRKRKSSR